MPAALALCLLLAPLPVAPQGTFAETRRMMPTLDIGYAETADGAAGDVNGDGYVDVLYVTDGADYLLYGSAATVFTDGSADLPSFPGLSTAVALGDLNGDGTADAVIGTSTGPSLVYVGLGGLLTLKGPLATPAPYDALDVDLADLDLDGDLDVVVASGPAVDSIGRIAVHENDGLAGFLYHPGAAGSTPETYALTVGDIDGDGKPDLLASHPSAGDRIYLGSGALSFPASIALGHASYESAVGDADNDGDLDLYLCGGVVGDEIAINLGGGAFQLQLTPVYSSARFSVFHDFDADGNEDVLAFGGAGPRYFRATGGGAFVNATGELPAGTVFGAPVVADLDGDSDPDVMHSGPWDGLWLRGPSDFRDYLPHFAPELDLVPGAATGDVNGDGALDIVTAYGRSYLAAGPDEFTDAGFSFSGPGGTVYDFRLADVDADGDLDALTAVYTELTLRTNDGTGFFTGAGGIAGAQFPLSFAAGDIDGDGDPDLVVGRHSLVVFLFGYASRSILLNDGFGGFSPGPAAPSSPWDSLDVELADLDQDGDLDLLVAGQETFAYDNLGTGAFSQTPIPLPTGIGCTALAVGDIEHDGDLDVVLARLHEDLMLINGGPGGFTLASPAQFPAPDMPSGKPYLVDVDGDDHLDVLILGSSHRVQYGDGAGAFGASETIAQGMSPAAVPIDLEGDGDLDVVGGGFGSLGAWTCIAGGQAARWSPPRIGKQERMQVFGDAGAPYFLAVAPFSASLQVPPYGTLALDPATLKLIASGAMPAEGRALVEVLIPPVPMLVNVTIHWQAIVNVPPRFTNGEPMLLTDY